jgi:hypothetical protein
MAIIAFIVFSEANNFARFVLFQGDGYAALAADCKLEIRTPIKLAKKFGSSLYASCREFARTHSRACVVYVLEPIIYCEGAGARAVVRRIEASPSFLEQFGRPSEQVLTLDHSLGRVLPIGRKMTHPATVSITDRNGQAHECVAEAFDTTFHVLVLVYPGQSAESLGRSTIKPVYTLPGRRGYTHAACLEAARLFERRAASDLVKAQCRADEGALDRARELQARAWLAQQRAKAWHLRAKHAPD